MKTRKTLALLTGLFLVAAWIGPAQAKKTEKNSGEAYATEKFQGESITKVKVASAFHVTIAEGAQTGVRIEIDSRLQPYLVCTLDRSGQLTIGMKNLPDKFGNSDNHAVKPTAVITVSRLDQLDVSGATRVKANGTFHTNNFTLKGSGAARVEGLHLARVENASFNTSGACRVENVKIDQAEKVRIDMSGAARLELIVDATEINTKASGAARIELTGKTEMHNIKGSGAARIDCDGLKMTRFNMNASGAARVSGARTANFRD